ncbi:MAG: protein kinase [Planctomycetes bacterium]|nr:protein kinase [Planctomycetota bacterium]
MDAQLQGRRLGDYELLELIGTGAMGAVYRARQTSLDRLVALKLLKPELARDPAFVARFQREARATARLSHPHIVAGIDVGCDEGMHFFAMEFVEGQTLRQLMERFKKLPEKELARIGAAMADALAHAHRYGIVHRDVKPENILLDSAGVPKLLDLGLSRIERGEDSDLTQTGTAVGTPHYMAPEQARGAKDLDGRCDAYALGCTLYHAATGRTPFEGPTGAVVMSKRLTETMPHPQTVRAELSDGFCSLLEQLTARERDDRPADLRTIAREFAALAAGQSVDSKALAAGKSSFGLLPAQGKRTRGPIRRDRRIGDTTRPGPAVRAAFSVLPIFIAAFAVLAVGVAWVIIQRNPGPSKPQTEPLPAPVAAPVASAVPPPTPVNQATPAETASLPSAEPAAKTHEPEDEAPPVAMPIVTRQSSVGALLPIFNGQDLAGWSTEVPRWRVEQGAIVGEGAEQNAYLQSRRALPECFELRVSVDHQGGAYHFGWSPFNSATAPSVFLKHGQKGTVELYRYLPGQPNRVYETVNADPAKPHAWRIEVAGTTVRVYMSEMLVLRTDEAEKCDAKGWNLHLFASKQSKIAYRGLEVRTLLKP